MIGRACARIVALLALTSALAAPARAQDVEPLPPLTEAQQQAVATGRQQAASYGDPAFDALLENTRAWNRLLFRWAGAPGRTPKPILPDQIVAMAETPDDSAGAPVVVFGELLEREPLPKYANVERWLVAPLDPENRDIQPDRAAIVFVDRTVSAAFDLPQKGWFVSIAGRFYKPLILPRRSTGEEVPYPSFVGASFSARQERGGPTSGLFAYVGLAIALFIAAAITMVVFISRIKTRPTRFDASAAPSAPHPVPAEEPGLPSDPAEALKHLADRADSADNQSNA